MLKLVKKNDIEISGKNISQTIFLKNKTTDHNNKKTMNSVSFLKKKKLKKKKKTLRLIKDIYSSSISGKPFNTYDIQKNFKVKKLSIRVVPNNVFCTFQDVETKNIIRSVSGGLYKLNISKKNLRVNSTKILLRFLNEIKDVHLKSLAIVIVAPKTIKKTLLSLIKSSFDKKLKNKFLYLDLLSNKVFNGCRPRKQIRKKRHGLRLYK